MFDDRTDAGRKLAQALKSYREEEPIVIGIPEGGIPVGLEVAGHFHAEFAVLVSRKLPFPDTPESGFGTVAEDGTLYLHEIAGRSLTEPDTEAITVVLHTGMATVGVHGGGGVQGEAASGSKHSGAVRWPVAGSVSRRRDRGPGRSARRQPSGPTTPAALQSGYRSLYPRGRRASPAVGSAARRLAR